MPPPPPTGYLRSAMTWDVRFARIDGREPARDWLDSLTGKDLPKRAAVVAALECVLARFGLDVCETEWGRNLGGALYELRIRHPEAAIRRMFRSGKDDAADEEIPPGGQTPLLRVFFTTRGRQVILLLGGYDKGRDPAARRQAAEIARARRYIAELKRAGQTDG